MGHHTPAHGIYWAIKCLSYSRFQCAQTREYQESVGRLHLGLSDKFVSLLAIVSAATKKNLFKFWLIPAWIERLEMMYNVGETYSLFAARESPNRYSIASNELGLRYSIANPHHLNAR